MRKFVFAAVAALFASQSAAQVPATPPKLLIVISVDQFSADLWDEYRNYLTSGFAWFGNAVSFRNGYQSHGATETCPGHSTILTGDHPSRTGIISNDWIDQDVRRSDVRVYCAEDETVPGSSSTAYTVSPRHLMVPTLGDLLKAQHPGSRNVAVSGKDRAAVMMSGHNVDQRWYWTGQKFETDLKNAPVPRVVARVNALVGAALAAPRPRDQEMTTQYCARKNRPIAIENSNKTVGGSTFARAGGDQAAFRASPDLDGATLALAAALIDELQLGRRPDPDLLSVSLSATDYVGHTFGTEGEEMCLQLTELDRQLGDFKAILDQRGIDYVLVLTADHGGLDIPERLRAAGVRDAARVDPSLAPGTMGAKLVSQLHLRGRGLLGDASFGDMYIDRSLKPRDRKRLLDAAVAAYRTHPQVEAVYTAGEIAAVPVPTGSPVDWSLIQRLRASYYAGRSGDFVVILKRDITPIADTSHNIATHGSVWDYDRRVPILFWRKGMLSQPPRNDVVETTDIMPTLAAMIGLPLAPGTVDGHCLDAVVQCPR